MAHHPPRIRRPGYRAPRLRRPPCVPERHLAAGRPCCRTTMGSHDRGRVSRLAETSIINVDTARSLVLQGANPAFQGLWCHRRRRRRPYFRRISANALLKAIEEPPELPWLLCAPVPEDMIANDPLPPPRLSGISPPRLRSPTCSCAKAATPPRSLSRARAQSSHRPARARLRPQMRASADGHHHRAASVRSAGEAVMAADRLLETAKAPGRRAGGRPQRPRKLDLLRQLGMRKAKTLKAFAHDAPARRRPETPPACLTDAIDRASPIPFRHLPRRPSWSVGETANPQHGSNQLVATRRITRLHAPQDPRARRLHRNRANALVSNGNLSSSRRHGDSLRLPGLSSACTNSVTPAMKTRQWPRRRAVVAIILAIVGYHGIHQRRPRPSKPPRFVRAHRRPRRRHPGVLQPGHVRVRVQAPSTATEASTASESSTSARSQSALDWGQPRLITLALAIHRSGAIRMHPRSSSTPAALLHSCRLSAAVLHPRYRRTVVKCS